MIKKIYYVLLLILIVVTLAYADETHLPDGDSSNSGGTSCDSNAYLTVDDDPDSPSGDWCTADTPSGSGDNWNITFTMENPTETLSTASEAQVIDVYVRRSASGGANPSIDVNIYDGINCVDGYDLGIITQEVTSDSGQKLSFTWTAGVDLSGSDDVCVNIACQRSGGSPSGRRSCDLDAIEWDAASTSSGGRRRVRLAANSIKIIKGEKYNEKK